MLVKDHLGHKVGCLLSGEMNAYTCKEEPEMLFLLFLHKIRRRKANLAFRFLAQAPVSSLVPVHQNQ